MARRRDPVHRARACLAGLLLGCMAFVGQAKELVRFPVSPAGGGQTPDRGEGMYSRPSDQGAAVKLPAVLLLHSGWGWSDDHDGVPGYAQALQKAGFATLELRMFARNALQKPGGPSAYLPEVYGALNYLAARPDIDPRRIGVAGYSYGGLLTAVAATSWANKTYGTADQRFAAFAPFYPVCWVIKANIQGRKSPVPAEAWLEWTGAPVLIFAGANDDYDSREPNACQAAIDSLPELQRRTFSVKVYPDATHGWDQRKAATFFEKLACNGRGCYNTNTPDLQLTEQSTKDLIDFMSKSMVK